MGFKTIIILKSLPLLLLSVLTGVGCRTPEPLGQAQKFEPVIGWQNQSYDEFGLPSRLPLHEAIKDGDIKSVRVQIANQAELNSKNQFGATPLHLATANGNLPVVQLLLQAGAKPGPRSIRSMMRTGLRWIVRYGKGRGSSSPSSRQSAK